VNNDCLKNLLNMFLDPSLDDKPHLAEEFEDTIGAFENTLTFMKKPLKDDVYKKKLSAVFEELKLPPWSLNKIKSTQDLNYHLHRYTKIVVNGDKMAHKFLKWR